MKILALDTALASCSVAVVADGRLLAHEAQAMQRGQAEALMPMVDRVMRASGLTFASLDLIGCTIGPGAFTGIRIGLSAARALALAAGCPVAGVTTLAAVAAGPGAAIGREGGPLLVALETKRADFYLQLFSAAGRPLGDPMAGLPAVAADLLEAHLSGADGTAAIAVAGDGADRLLADAAPELRFRLVRAAIPDQPDAVAVARLAQAAAAAGADLSIPPAPLYLRAPDVTLPKPKSP